LLVYAGYERIRNEDHSTSEEDWITQRLVEETNQYLRSPDRPRWAERYSVRDQVLQSVPGKPTKQRPKIDIQIESVERHRPEYHFEAKRLRVDDLKCVPNYLNEGLARFLVENYARRSHEGAMLGYIQSQTPAHWKAQILASLRKNPAKYRQTSSTSGMADSTICDQLITIGWSTHARPTRGAVAIFHSVLDFCKSG
jgi:hypothetical protein